MSTAYSGYIQKMDSYKGCIDSVRQSLMPLAFVRAVGYRLLHASWTWSRALDENASDTLSNVTPSRPASGREPSQSNCSVISCNPPVLRIEISSSLRPSILSSTFIDRDCAAYIGFTTTPSAPSPNCVAITRCMIGKFTLVKVYRDGYVDILIA